MAGKLLTSLAPGYSALVIGASGGVGHDEESVHLAADRFQSTSFDLIVCATGALTIDGVGPEKSIHQISMMNQFAVNAIGPALLLKYFAPLLAKKKRGDLSFPVGSRGVDWRQ